MPDITYRRDTPLDLEQVIQLYRDSTLGERRPVEDRDRMRQMLKNANLVLTAWQETSLIGIARSLSDFAYCTYLSDLAVHLQYQRAGIGRELIRLTREAAPLASTILLAAPQAVEYYPRIGFTRHESAWILRPADPLL